MPKLNEIDVGFLVRSTTELLNRNPKMPDDWRMSLLRATRELREALKAEDQLRARTPAGFGGGSR